MLVNGVTVSVRRPDGTVTGEPARVVNFDNPDNNDWLAVSQFTVRENRATRRADIVLFLNGLPLGIIELKNPADENADVWDAWQQLQTYQAELPALFSMNEALIVSDSLTARIGALGAGREWFKPWRTITGETLADPHLTELQVLLEGVYQPRHFLDLIRDFIVFDDDGSGKLVKKMAGYHQFHAVRATVGETLRASELQDEARLAGEETGRYESGRRPGGSPGDRSHRLHPREEVAKPLTWKQALFPWYPWHMSGPRWTSYRCPDRNPVRTNPKTYAWTLPVLHD